MKNLYKPILLLPLFLTYCNITSENASNTENNDSIVATLEQLMIENEVPGINLSIIDKNGKQKCYSVGYADIAKNEPLTEKHVMFSGSVGKTYAVAVLMQLVNEGKIDLEQKIIHYFPEIKWLERLPNIQDITVKMLLQHTSGLPRYIEKQAVWDSVQNNPDKVWSYEDRLSFIFDDEPVHKAGKGWAYSDTNYLLIGMLIEKITGSYYYDEVINRILKPENLTETHPANKRVIQLLSNGYSKLDTFFRMPEVTVTEKGYAFNPQMEWTGGGIASTTSDLAKWAKIYYTSKLFPKELLQQMTTPNENGLNTGKNEAYGMGSFIYKTKIGTAYGHTGFVPGFVSIFAYYPKQEIAVAMQINCDYAKKKMSLVEYLDRIMLLDVASD